MVIVEDTRNQIGKHKLLNSQLKELGYEVIRTKLYVGDYSKLDDMSVCIDTKKDWVEVAGNICGKQHERFRDECLRAKNAGIKLIILVEDAVPIHIWKSPRKRSGDPLCHVDPMVLLRAMSTMTAKYGVLFKHCEKSNTAREIVKILRGQNGSRTFEEQTTDGGREKTPQFDC